MKGLSKAFLDLQATAESRLTLNLYVTWSKHNCNVCLTFKLIEGWSVAIEDITFEDKIGAGEFGGKSSIVGSITKGRISQRVFQENCILC